MRCVRDVPVPYLYNQSVGTLLYTRLIADLGINFRHLLHVHHETKHWASVPGSDLVRLESGRAHLRTLAELRRKDPQLDATQPGSVVGAIRVPANMGKRFGQVSGDFNPVHTTQWAARMFGVKRPFLQGLGLRNAMIRQLALHSRPLVRFSMSFATPAFLDQTLRVVMQGDAFELVDEGGQVVAFGAGNEET
jgi:acyl dehydratase